MRRLLRPAAAVLAALLLLIAGVVLTRRPSDDRSWAADHARLATVLVGPDSAWIRNARDFRHLPDGSWLEGYRHEAYALSSVRGVWFVLAPFASRFRGLAHTFLSFEMDDGRYLAVSVEARREADERYSLGGGLLRGFEVVYVVGTEEDLLGQRAARGDTLFLYPSVATPEQARALFVDVLARADETRREPEFYNTLWNNCTTNLRDHVNRATPAQLPWGWGVLLPGYSDELALEEGLLAAPAELGEARRRFRADEAVREELGRPDFSAAIRAGGSGPPSLSPGESGGPGPDR